MWINHLYSTPVHSALVEPAFAQSQFKEMEQPLRNWDCSSLENVLREHSCVYVDVSPRSHFADFLSPNEKHPQDILPHLQKMSKGLIVSVGTERSFFDLLLSDNELCEGLVVRDVNPRVKAYVDFNVLLFRTAETREEYCVLAGSPQSSEEESQRHEILAHKIKESLNIPPFLQEYYLKNLIEFASVYYSVSKQWAQSDVESENFENVNYFKDDFSFKKIQTLATQGKIVATVGDINDLSFLHGQKISVIDVSNVPDYTMLDLSGCEISNHCLIIWTALGYGYGLTNYFSYFPTDFPLQERIELDLLLNKLRDARIDTSTSLSRFLQEYAPVACDISPSNRAPAASYSRDTLILVKKYIDQNLYEIEGFGCVLIDSFDNISKLNSVPVDLLHKMVSDPQIKRFVYKLVDGISFLRASTYIAFMDVHGWKEVFETKASDQEFLNEVAWTLQKEGLLQTLIDRFGKERIAKWGHQAQLILTRYVCKE